MIKKIFNKNYIYLIFIVVLFLISLILFKTDIYNYIINFDNIVIEYIKTIRSDNLTIIMKLFTTLGSFYVPLILLFISLLILKNKYFYLLTGNYAFVSLITYTIKTLIGRARPETAIIDIPLSYSFPSGHTLTSFGFYIIFAYLLSYNLNKKYKIIYTSVFTFMCIMIGFSRIYLGVHYFSDVIGGIIFSIPCILIIKNIIHSFIGGEK